MAHFYFDESIHPAAGFVLGAMVGSREDQNPEVARVLAASGLRPSLDEYKSSIRMRDNPTMRTVRDRFLQELIRPSCRIGVVVAPVDHRFELGLDAMRGLQKILTSSGIEKAGHTIFLDQGLVNDRTEFDTLVASLGLSGNVINIEQDSVLIGGLQLADMVAHTCATMLRAEMGLVTKRVNAGENAGLDPDQDIELEFLLWGGLREIFFAAPPPPPDEWTSQLDWQSDVESRGLYIADTCSESLRAAAVGRFGRMYFGCTH
jgi:hypothetical protein